MLKTYLLLSCEHASPKIPKEFLALFQTRPDVLETHRGYDAGAKEVFNLLSKTSDFKLTGKVSRLLIDLNRSEKHPKLFSEFSQNLGMEKKNFLLKQYYYPYRSSVLNWLDEKLNRQWKGKLSGHDVNVIHLSIHSFTPELNGEKRNADIGILFDPKRKGEAEFAELLKSSLKSEGWHVRKNYPYLGIADGFTTYLRKKFQVGYHGLEIELNQALFGSSTDRANQNSVANAIQSAILQIKEKPWLQ